MPKENRYGLIMAGGRGTRFWPRSRKSRAKQVLSIAGETTLIQQTVERLKPLLPPERIFVITSQELKAEVVKQLPEVPKNQILAEPAARNTAPCIGLAAHMIQSVDPDAVMGVFPADHYITKPNRFLRLLKPAFKAAERGQLVTLGIQPRWPETGYGYLELPKGTEPGSLETYPVKSFREKPDLATAKKYVANGRFFWNAGMFFWRTDVILDAMRHHLPKVATLLAALPPFTKKGFTQALEQAFPLCEGISIDYGIMEKADNVVAIAADDIGWNDLGSWNAVWELLERDDKDNAVRADALLEDVKGSYIDANGKLVALLGVKDLIVVDTPDALLVAHRSRAQEVGDLVKKLEKMGRTELL